MKIKILLLTLSVFAINVLGQVQKFPEGVYLNINQLKNQAPAFDIKLRVIKRTSGDITMNGGNDYKLESDIDSINKRYIKKKIFAYVKDDSIFLNCSHNKLTSWYALCLTTGNFLAFKTNVPDENAAIYGVMFGAVGGAIAGAVDAHKRYLYVLSLRTGNARPLGKVYLTARLEENQNLLNEYNNEKDQESEPILLKYIDLLNKIITPTSVPPPSEPKSK